MEDREYADRLVQLQEVRWKRLLDVQAPYRWSLRRLELGFTLEIGCGIGRNLAHLHGNAIGVDLNPYCVEEARRRGFGAFTPEQFAASEWGRLQLFDTLLMSHVAEHMRRGELIELLRSYLDAVRAGGRVVLITPQEAGFRSDPTHVEFMDLTTLRAVADELGLEQERDASFPLPRAFGRVFRYNEFLSVSRKPAPPGAPS